MSYDYEILEGEGAYTEEEYFSALQKTINSGTGWMLQGSVGRTMMEAIRSGDCMLGENGVRDYWGNYIPARSEVQEGTKGSFDYVAEQRGVEWAEKLAAL